MPMFTSPTVHVPNVCPCCFPLCLLQKMHNCVISPSSLRMVRSQPILCVCGGVCLCERVLLALNAMTSPFYAFNSMVVTGVIQIAPIFSGTPDRIEQTQIHK